MVAFYLESYGLSRQLPLPRSPVCAIVVLARNLNIIKKKAFVYCIL